MNQSVKLAISRMEPTTKAAQLRLVMPAIEEKLAAGVQLGAIHKALVTAGFDLTFQTLKTYLYRYRKKEQSEILAGNTASQPSPMRKLPQRDLTEASKDGLSEKTPSRGPMSMQDIDRLMKPDPVAQAEKLARYERLAKQQRRGQL